MALLSAPQTHRTRLQQPVRRSSRRFTVERVSVVSYPGDLYTHLSRDPVTHNADAGPIRSWREVGRCGLLLRYEHCIR